MKHATHPDILKRLKRANGHLASTIAMIEEGRDCPVVAQQLHAVIRALENAKRTFIHDHIDHCLADGRPRAEMTAEFREIAKYL